MSGNPQPGMFKAPLTPAQGRGEVRCDQPQKKNTGGWCVGCGKLNNWKANHLTCNFKTPMRAANGEAHAPTRNSCDDHVSPASCSLNQIRTAKAGFKIPPQKIETVHLPPPPTPRPAVARGGPAPLALLEEGLLVGQQVGLLHVELPQLLDLCPHPCPLRGGGQRLTGVYRTRLFHQKERKINAEYLGSRLQQLGRRHMDEPLGGPGVPPRAQNLHGMENMQVN